MSEDSGGENLNYEFGVRLLLTEGRGAQGGGAQGGGDITVRPEQVEMSPSIRGDLEHPGLPETRLSFLRSAMELHRPPPVSPGRLHCWDLSSGEVRVQRRILSFIPIQGKRSKLRVCLHSNCWCELKMISSTFNRKKKTFEVKHLVN